MSIVFSAAVACLLFVLVRSSGLVLAVFVCRPYQESVNGPSHLIQTQLVIMTTLELTVDLGKEQAFKVFLTQCSEMKTDV